MIRYTTTVFLSAFLLFQVQPLISKYILPWFGGTPAVWSTCMLFFQLLLVAGYVYAHGITRWLRPKTQGLCHVALLLVSATLLPITPAASWRPTDAANPTLQILVLLLFNVGGPYLLLAATAPLLQSWFARAHSDSSPYWLYALSNTGSLLGLFTYPFIVEHSLTLQAQTRVWSIVYGFFAVLCTVCAFDVWRRGPLVDEPQNLSRDAAADTAAVPPRFATIALWLALSACGSVMLLATTNLMCQNVASVPFLWVLPLGLYLSSFIAVFGNERLYQRHLFAVAMILATTVVVVLALQAMTLSLVLQIVLYSGVLTLACFVCHGELVNLRPSPHYLTLFYLIIAVGGAIGGVLVTLVAPLIFTGFYEFNLGLVACIGLLLLLYRRDRWMQLPPATARREFWVSATVVVLIGSLSLSLMWAVSTASMEDDESFLARQRNFFGVLYVLRRDANSHNKSRLVMVHGNTTHGSQFESAELRAKPTLYFSRDSGVGLAIVNHPCYAGAKRPIKLGVVGLGAGTLCCYARPGDFVRFYEIDPLVVEMSQKYFTYQSDAKRRGAHVEVVLGDARIVMERELAQRQPQQYDILVIDAFSSDSIPLHLLTRECFQVYRKHLRADGLLAVHVSNRHLDLRPAVKSMADHFGYHAVLIQHSPDISVRNGTIDSAGSVWIILTRNEELVASPMIREASQPWPKNMPLVMLTDDASSLLQLLNW